jgi:hypothetical protein
MLRAPLCHAMAVFINQLITMVVSHSKMAHEQCIASNMLTMKKRRK